jgi:hypothetical protein
MATSPGSLVARVAERARWSPMLQAFVLTFGLAAPTLILEENWHGQPMIDQPGYLWVLPTLVVAAAFALGGSISARRAAEMWKAMVQGIILGTLVAGTLLGADVGRRALVHRAISEGVLRLWVEAALLSVVIASLGGAISYLRSTFTD